MALLLAGVGAEGQLGLRHSHSHVASASSARSEDGRVLAAWGLLNMASEVVHGGGRCCFRELQSLCKLLGKLAISHLLLLLEGLIFFEAVDCSIDDVVGTLTLTSSCSLCEKRCSGRCTA